ARFPGVSNLGDLRAVDWAAVPPVDLVTAGFPCLNVKLGSWEGLPEGAAGFVDHLQQRGGRGLCGHVLEQVPAGVAVGPVQPPAGAVVAELGDRPPGPLRAVVFAPGRSD